MQSIELANKGFKSLIYDQLVAQIELIEKLGKVFLININKFKENNV